MNYVLSLGREIIEKRKLIWDLGKADFRKRFVGSYFGIVWMFIQPIVTIAIYAIIFGPAGFRTPPPVPGASYVAWLVAGIVPWFFYSEVLNTVTNCLQEYSYLVKKVVFKVEMLPIIKLLSCLMVHFFFVLIMLALYAALLFGFAGVLCRLFYLASRTDYAARAAAQSTVTLELPARRGGFYDCMGLPLTGLEKRWMALCFPGQENYTRLYACTDTAGQELLYRSRSRAAPFLVEVDRDMTALGIPCYAASRRYAAAPLCPQLLGYLDGEGHGAAGLEKALDALLTGSGARDTLLCPVTAQGALRTGEQVQHLQADSGAVGVRLTLSRSVQRAAEAVAAQTMTTGCILVLDVRTAALRACVSVPGFDPADPAASLEAPNSPFLNRALQAYAVGSVFKPVLAAAALEAGLAPEYDCNGAVVVDGQIFRCAGGVPHGEVDLSAALAKSCNGYFIRLGQQLGAQALLQQAQALGFGRSIGLAEGLTAQSGALPGAEELAQSGQLANFSFGQGSLLATPLQVAAMMNTIANGGVYRAPCLLDCALDETSGEELSAFARPQAERVLTEQTAAALRTMLEQTVAEGTAQDASGLPGGAAGKTGTAQTGQFTAEGKERMNLWFAGFYPAEDPQYTIVVLQDGQTQATVSSAAVFAQLCTALHWLG